MDRVDWTPTGAAGISLAAPGIAPPEEAGSARLLLARDREARDREAREREALGGLARWRLRARRAARAQARRLAAADLESERQAGDRALRQAERDRDRALLLANDPPAVRRALATAYAALDVAAAPAVIEEAAVTASVLLPPVARDEASGEPTGEHDPLAAELAGIAFEVARATCAAAPGVERACVLVLRDPGGTALPRPLLYGSLPRSFALRHRPPPADETLAALLDDGELFRRATTTREALPIELPSRSDLRAALALAALRGA